MQLNAHLEGKGWLVGGRLTLADIVVFNAVLAPFNYCFDPGFRKAIPFACSWFDRISKLPFVSRNAGFLKMMGAGSSQSDSTQAATVEKKQKGGKQEQPKKEAKAKPEPKKKKEEDDANFDPFASGEDDIDPFASDGEDDAAAKK